MRTTNTKGLFRTNSGSENSESESSFYADGNPAPVMHEFSVSKSEHFWVKWKLGTRALAGLKAAGLAVIGVPVAVCLGAMLCATEAVLKVGGSMLLGAAATLGGLVGALCFAVKLGIEKFRPSPDNSASTKKDIKESLVLAAAGLIGTLTLGAVSFNIFNEDNLKRIVDGDFSKPEFAINPLYKGGGPLVNYAKSMLTGGVVGVPIVDFKTRKLNVVSINMEGLIPAIQKEANIVKTGIKPSDPRLYQAMRSPFV